MFTARTDSRGLDERLLELLVEQNWMLTRSVRHKFLLLPALRALLRSHPCEMTDHAAIAYMLISILAALNEEQEHEIELRMLPRIRRASKRRVRAKFEGIAAYLSDSEFQYAFRLSRRSFSEVASNTIPSSCA